jgi:CII-binding regulator of phage lambda lysogenization HflD
MEERLSFLEQRSDQLQASMTILAERHNEFIQQFSSVMEQVVRDTGEQIIGIVRASEVERTQNQEQIRALWQEIAGLRTETRRILEILLPND